MINKYPLIELGMSRKDCIDYLQQNNLPVPPKSSCMICPYKLPEDWLSIKNTHPDIWEEIIKYDNMIRDMRPNNPNKVNGELYLYSKLIPLADADLEKAVEERANKNNNKNQMPLWR